VVSNQEQEKLVLDNLDFARKIGLRVIKDMNIRKILYEDCIAISYQGLVDAAVRYNPKYGSKFTTYAYIRIKGCLIDYIRRECTFSKYAYDKVRKLRLNEFMHDAKDNEAENKDINQQISHNKNKVYSTETVSKKTFEKLAARDFIKKEDEKRIYDLVQLLPKKQKIVILNKYYFNYSLKEIAKYLNMSTSNVSRRHTNAVLKLKKLMKVQ